jgi:hypothetical protein
VSQFVCALKAVFLSVYTPSVHGGIIYIKKVVFGTIYEVYHIYKFHIYLQQAICYFRSENLFPCTYNISILLPKINMLHNTCKLYNEYIILKHKHGLSTILSLYKHRNPRLGQVELSGQCTSRPHFHQLLRVSSANPNPNNCSISITYSVVYSIHSVYLKRLKLCFMK